MPDWVAWKLRKIFVSRGLRDRTPALARSRPECSYEVSREVVLGKLEVALRESCPGLLGHDRSEICPVPLSAPGTG